MLAQAETVGLELQVGLLAAGDLVLVNEAAFPLFIVRVHSKGAYRVAVLFPVGRVLAHGQLEAGVAVAALGGRHQDAHARLGAHSAHGVDGAIDNVGAGLRGGQHGGEAITGSVVGVHVDEEPGRARLQQAGHVLDGQDVGARLGDRRSASGSA